MFFYYQIEFVEQNDYGGNQARFNLGYYHLQPKISFSGPLNGTVAAWVGYEVLEGDDNSSFQTPLATLHRFNGWADKFLTTPASRIEDTYGGVSYQIPKVRSSNRLRLMAIYHEFDANRGGRGLGEELNLLAGRIS